MIGEDAILEVLSDWNLWGSFDVPLKSRRIYLGILKEFLGGREAVVVKGVRRAGKSSLTILLLKHLQELGWITVKDALIVNLEDPRFPSTLSSEDLLRIYQVYLKKLSPSSNHVVVLDEVQVVKGWERFVRYLLEAKGVKVVVTGSSSKLMGEEYASSLTGRHVDVEVFPLSFHEYLEFKGLALTGELDAVRERHRVEFLLDEYVYLGGFPEVVLAESRVRKAELLRRYFEDIIVKDVVKRYRVKHVHKLEELAKIFLTNVSMLQSLNRIRKTLNLSLDTVERFSKYLETARLVFFIPRFGFSLKQRILTPKKVYAIDTGLASTLGFRTAENYGQYMENVVAVELLRRKTWNPRIEIYYWRDHQQREVDFLLKEGGAVKHLIQVCYASDRDEVPRREERSLMKAMEELHLKHATIITKSYQEEREEQGLTVRFIPIWRWILQEAFSPNQPTKTKSMC